MGAKKSRPLNEGELNAIAEISGLDRFTVQGLFMEFEKNSKNGLMSKKQFRSIYGKLDPDNAHMNPLKLRKLSGRVFKAFDKDKSGKLDFNNEFIPAYVMLMKQGDARKKMEFLLKKLSDEPILPSTVKKNEIKTILKGFDTGYGVDRAKQTYNALVADGTGNETDEIPTERFITYATDKLAYGELLERGADAVKHTSLSSTSSEESSVERRQSVNL